MSEQARMTPPLVRNFLMKKNLWFHVADQQQEQLLQNYCHFLYTLLLKTTFSSGVVYCGSGVGGFSRAGPADPVQLVFSPLHPNTQTLLEGTAVCRQSWGCKEKSEIRQTFMQLYLNTWTIIYLVLCRIFHSLGKRCHPQQGRHLQRWCWHF